MVSIDAQTWTTKRRCFQYINKYIFGFRLSARMSTTDLRGGHSDLLAEEGGHLILPHLGTLTSGGERPPPHHKSRSRGLANIDPKFTSQVSRICTQYT